MNNVRVRMVEVRVTANLERVVLYLLLGLRLLLSL